MMTDEPRSRDAPPTDKHPRAGETTQQSADPHAPRQSLLRHGGGFLVSGLIAFSVDALVLLSLTRWAGLDPFSARIIAIALAMVAGWLSHRRFTFNVVMPPTIGEFGRYAAVAWTAAALNYAVYAFILIFFPNITPLVAMVGATVVAMGFSYLGMRFGVFRNHH